MKLRSKATNRMPAFLEKHGRLEREKRKSELACKLAPKFAAVLYEELDKGAWGRIDPYWFKIGAEGCDSSSENEEEQRSWELIGVLQRALAKVL